MDELFPVTTVGSWPRSARLRRALRQRQAGEISGEEFDAVADEAVLDALQHQEAAGVDKLRLRSGLAQDEVAFLQRHTQRPIKVPLPGPYLLTRSAWIEQLSGDAYATQEDLAADVVSIL